MDGLMCEWVPASAGSERMLSLASLQQERTTAASGAQSSAPLEADSSPVRVIRDNYPSYSAIVVDTNYNEVFLLDENLFGLNVYDRLTNTPPTAAFSEPKRLVRGEKTYLEFVCGLYIDP